MGDISGRHDIVLNGISYKVNDNQTAVTKSQGDQDVVEQLQTWPKDHKLEQLKPISLNQDKLNKQAQQLSCVEMFLKNMTNLTSLTFAKIG